jgi:hypothetical protein
VRVHYDEGLANHIGPEPCTGIREGVGEAQVKGLQRPAIEPRKWHSLGRRRCSVSGRQYGRERYRKRPYGPAWS